MELGIAQIVPSVSMISLLMPGPGGVLPESFHTISATIRSFPRMNTFVSLHRLRIKETPVTVLARILNPLNVHSALVFPAIARVSETQVAVAALVRLLVGVIDALMRRLSADVVEALVAESTLVALGCLAAFTGVSFANLFVASCLVVVSCLVAVSCLVVVSCLLVSDNGRRSGTLLRFVFRCVELLLMTFNMICT